MYSLFPRVGKVAATVTIGDTFFSIAADSMLQLLCRRDKRSTIPGNG